MKTKKNWKPAIIIGSVAFLTGVVLVGIVWYFDSRKTAKGYQSTIQRLQDSIEERFNSIKTQLDESKKE